MSADDGPVGRREVAYRLFAAEFDDADLEYSDSDEERAPNYVVTPTGARVNRLFAVGVLTEVEPVSDDVLRARVVDPTGAFVTYAGQYQPEAVAFLEDADVPSFVSLTGKARTFQPDGSDRVFTSVRPESITTVDAETRDRWTVQAAEHTLARIATMARALDREERGEALTASLREAGVEPGLASGVGLAIDHYGTTAAYLSALRAQAVAAAEIVSGDREEVPDLELAPDDAGPVDGDLTVAPTVSGTLSSDAEIPVAAAEPEPGPEPTPEPEAAAEPEEGAAPDVEPEPAETHEPSDAEPAEAEPEPDAEPDDEQTAPPAPDATADEPAPEVANDDLGDFEGMDVTGEEPAATTEQYDLDDAEREEVEAEFGTEFSTGSEVGEPGEAGIEPETEPPATGDDEATPIEGAPAAEPEPTDEPDPDAEGADDDDAAEVDLEDAAVEAMAALDDGDGADHEAVVEAVVDAHGAEADAVEEAIQDALMGGRCYEPADGTLKAI